MKAMFYATGNRFATLSALCLNEVRVGSDIFFAIRPNDPERNQSTIFSKKSILT